mgnify:CR=1 FL=1
MVRTAPQRTSEAPRKVRKKSDSLSKNRFDKLRGADVFHPRPWRYFSAFATRSRVAVWF